MNQFSNKNYDLGERTSIFSENVILLCKELVSDRVSEPVINQLVRSASSVGANYMEAINGSSKKDFKNKIYFCKKEAQEAGYWLRILEKCFPLRKQEINLLSKESHELLLIFQRIVSTLLIAK